MATDDGAVGAHGRSFLHMRGTNLIHFTDFRPGIIDVGEDHRRAAEDAVFESDTLINADVVLNLAFVADDCVGADDNILADVAVFADPGPGEDMGEVPDFCTLADLDFIIHDGGFMDENIGINILKLITFLDSRLRGNDSIYPLFLLFDGLLTAFKDF